MRLRLFSVFLILGCGQNMMTATCRTPTDCTAGSTCVSSRCAPIDAGSAGSTGTGGMTSDAGQGGMGGSVVLTDAGVDAGHDAGVDAGRPDAGPDLDAGPPGSGETCVDALVLTVGTITGTTMGFGSDYRFTANGTCRTAGGPADVAYKIRVPPSDRLTVTLTTDAGDFDSVLNLVADDPLLCGGPDAGCLAGIDDGLGGAPETLGWVNTSAQTRTVFLVVSGYAAGDVGTFELTTTVAAPPPGDSCTMPTAFPSNAAVDGGFFLPRESLNGFGDDFNSNTTTDCDGVSSGPDRAYTVRVPAGQRLIVDAQPSVDLDLGLAIAENAASCASGQCISGVNDTAEGGAEQLRWDNATATEQEVVVLVDGVGTMGDTFSLRAIRLTPMVVPGDICGLPKPISMSGTLTGESTAGFDSNYITRGSGCSFASGTDVVYAVTLDPRQRLRVDATSMGDVVLNFIPGPASNCTNNAICVASTDDNSSGTETAQYTNAGAAMQVVYVVVSRYSGQASITYDITFMLTP